MITLYRYQLPFRRPFHTGGEPIRRDDPDHSGGEQPAVGARGDSHPDQDIKAGNRQSGGHTERESRHETGRRIWQTREGLVIRFKTRNRDLLAEAAPLPGLSGESLNEVSRQFESLTAGLERAAGSTRPGEALRELLQEPLFPSAEFALSALALELLEETGRIETTAAVLQDDRVAVNGIVGSGDLQQMTKEIEHLRREGFRTLKLKSPGSPEPLIPLIKSLSKSYPELTFRIDANRSWPPERVAEWLDRLAGLPVTCCEEPCRFDDLEQMSDLCRSSPIPIALDESLEDLATVRRAIREGICNRLVLKPTLLGSLFELLEIGRETGSRGADAPQIIVTTALESGIGRCAVTRLAACIGSPKLAHGLDTGRLLEQDPLREKGGPWRRRQEMSWAPATKNCDLRLLNCT